MASGGRSPGGSPRGSPRSSPRGSPTRGGSGSGSPYRGGSPDRSVAYGGSPRSSRSSTGSSYHQPAPRVRPEKAIWLPDGSRYRGGSPDRSVAYGGSPRSSRSSTGSSYDQPAPSSSGPTLGEENDVLTVMVLGPKEAGKSALARSFVYGKFKPAISLTNTSEELSQKIGFQVDVNGRTEVVDLAIMTLAPSGREYPAKRLEGIRDCDCIILCFSVLHKSHFRAMDEYKKLIMQHRGPLSVGVALVGTHCDFKEKDMKIKLSDGEKWARAWGPEWSVRFSQVMSPESANVADPFTNAVETFLAKKQLARQEAR